MAKYIMLNSEIIPSSEPCLFHNNRGLLYGDSFNFEMRGNSSKAFLSDEYFEFMISSMQSLGMERPLFLKKTIFATELELLLQKNRIYKGFSANISIFRNNSTSKLSEDNSTSILISVEALANEYYQLNTKGLKIDLYKKNIIETYILKNCLTPIFNFELLLKKELEEKDIDDFLLIDSNSNIIKAIDSNVFFVKNGYLIFSKNIINNYKKIFCQHIIKLALKLNIKVVSSDIKEADLVNLDEIFLVNPVWGIKWILAYKEKRYYNKVSSLLFRELNLALQKN